jgi:RNA polymerase sigma-70 factor (ECF subfamily)
LTIERFAPVGAPAANDVPTVLSFERIYAERFTDVLRWVRALGGMDADLDDITQDVFLVVRRKLAEFDGKNLNAWLYTIARRQVSDYRRRAWMRRIFRGTPKNPDADEAPIFVQPGADPSQLLERREMQTFLKNILNKMSLAQRTAFVLFEIESYSGEEIAELEGIPLNTVWTRLHHARKRFFDLIDKARGEGKLP